MKYCRKPWSSRVMTLFVFLILMPSGVISLITSICWLAELNLVFSILSLLIGIFLLWFGKIEYSFEARLYSIAPEGLFLGNMQKAFYAWEQIYEIGIYPFDAAASLEVYDKVICCSFAPPSANFKHNLFHNPRFYAQRNQNKFVVIDYDDATITEFSNAYPKKIVDYTVGMNGYIRNRT